MRTRCPRCRTVFRVTPEQLRARGGRVRCGQCQTVFNALESLVEEPPTPVHQPEPTPTEVPLPETVQPPQQPVPSPEPEPQPEPVAEPPFETFEREAIPFFISEPESEPTAPTEPEDTGKPAEPPAPAELSEETPEETTQAAREAGLMAAREMAPGHNRWAAGTLAGSPLAGLDHPAQRPTWPFLLVSLLLALGLLAQVAYYFRTELVQRFPGLEESFAALGVDVPQPRQADLVSIETSDLQSDNSRGLLVLQATLKNQAPYPQDWPALELTLTDTQDKVLARRVLEPADYLPSTANTKTFAARSDFGLRLWIETKDIAAAGYRLYVFYP